MSYDFAVVGGDRRFFYLAQFLKNKKFKVIGFNLFNFENEICEFEVATSLQEALMSAKNWVLPIPVSRDGIFLNVEKKVSAKLKISEILSLARKEVGVFGGAFSNCLHANFKKRVKFIYDYLESESFAVFNAGLTAQAAIAQAVLKSSFNFNSSCCLVLGFGRCGKLLALELKKLCFKVVVCTRNEIQLAWARALGFEAFNLACLGSGKPTNLKQFNLIFNTIPKKILSGSILDSLNEEVFIFDITPNGIDSKELEKKSINFFVSLQIPGKFKPKPSAEYLSNLVVEFLNI